jgi:hypothetical protein
VNGCHWRQSGRSSVENSHRRSKIAWTFCESCRRFRLDIRWKIGSQCLRMTHLGTSQSRRRSTTTPLLLVAGARSSKRPVLQFQLRKPQIHRGLTRHPRGRLLPALLLSLASLQSPQSPRSRQARRTLPSRTALMLLHPSLSRPATTKRASMQFRPRRRRVQRMSRPNTKVSFWRASGVAKPGETRTRTTKPGGTQTKAAPPRSSSES